MSRIHRILSLLWALAATVLLPATAAVASVPPPDPTPGPVLDPGPSGPYLVSTSGLGLWAVVLIAGAALVAGIVATELVRGFHRHGGHSSTATA